MVDRAEKFLRKVTDKQSKKLRKTVRDIEKGNLVGLDIKPLAGKKGWYRCRLGKIRIIFIKTGFGKNTVHYIDWRGGAYKKK